MWVQFRSVNKYMNLEINIYVVSKQFVFFLNFNEILKMNN